MSKLAIPKHTSDVTEIHSALSVYDKYHGKWLENKQFVEEIKLLIGDGQYPSSYNKKYQIPWYFGFIEAHKNDVKLKRITHIGSVFLNNIDRNEILAFELLLSNLETINQGKNNLATKTSDSFIEPINLFLRLIVDLEGLNHSEFTYSITLISEYEKSYEEVKLELTSNRSDENFRYTNDLFITGDYKDNKPIMYLEKIGFLNKTHDNYYLLSNLVKSNFLTRIKSLKIFNEEIPRVDVQSITGANNILYYGVPGSGKSYKVNQDYKDYQTRLERVVFHPEYHNGDFIGQILPVIEEDDDEREKLLYKFVPGPFTRMLKKAVNKPEEKHVLIIEELNRGNAPSIFGEVFQLLDRDEEGRSRYSISNYDIAQEVFGNPNIPLVIPSNLEIVATMNTSDQNIFTLDTAFQRRWQMTNVKNDIRKAQHSSIEILDTKVTWEKFHTAINEKILEHNDVMNSLEDKRLGIYFISDEDLEDDSRLLAEAEKMESVLEHTLFGDKVIKYLWDDVFRFNRDSIFKDSFKSIEEVLEVFHKSECQERFEIFNFKI
ncbi:MAG TPA: restriction endonuclease [Jeotgalicoccus sp.]|nr:restriction endonuclease [Jeotgalicoccus sp.]